MDCFPYVPISELNRIVLAWVLFVKEASGYALLMENDLKVLLILNFFSFNQSLSIQCLESLPYVQKLLWPVCIDHTYINCWFMVHRWSVMEKNRQYLEFSDTGYLY